MVSLNDFVSSRDGTRLKLDIQGQGGGEILDVDGQRVGVLKIRQFSWTSCMYLYVCMYLYD